MPTVHIRHFTASYCDASTDDRNRLDRLLTAEMSTTLPAALDRAGVANREEICVRDVRNATRLRLADSDERVAVAWTLSLADAIARKVAEGGPDVVRYRSRRDACIDMLEGAAVGDMSRRWAWRQLGFWPVNDRGQSAETTAIITLGREAELAVPVLVELARRGSLEPLMRQASPAAWRSLAQAVLRAHLAPASLSTPDSAAIAEEPVSEWIMSLAIASAILRAAAAVLTGSSDPGLARALAIVGLLETEPARVRSPDARVVASQLSRWLAEQAGPGRPRDADAIAPVHSLGNNGVQRDGSDPRWPSPVENERLMRGDAETTAPRRGTTSAASVSNARSMRPDRPGYGVLQPERQIPDVRRSAWSDVAGIVFLLNLVPECGVIEAADPGGPLSGRSVRWVMHRLALALASRFAPAVSERDPALLAFAGLAPDRDPPGDDDNVRDAAADDRVAIDALHARVVDALRRRYAAVDDDADALLERVCARRAEIAADPGWIEVRFSLSEARTDIRRAGLDLDPGWLPWLGVVVRFVYA